MSSCVIDDDMRLKILRAKPIIIDNKLSIKQYTLNEILDNEDMKCYNSYISMILNNPYELRVALFESGIMYSEFNHWNLFISFFMSENTHKSICDGFEVLFGLNLSEFTAYEKDKSVILISNIDGYEIDEFKFTYVVSIYREILGFNNTIPKFANNTAIMYELKREARRIKKKRNMSEISLNSIVEAIWVNLNLDIEDIFKMTMYQLNRAIYRIDKDKKYLGTLTGIYTGNIKADDVQFNKISWFSK